MPSSSDERTARSLICGEGSACRRAVEQHASARLDPLTQRVLPRKRCQLGDQLGVAAELEIGLDALLQRPDAQLLEACDRRLSEGVVGEIRERRAAPQPQCLVQLGSDDRRICPRCLGAQLLEAMNVELTGLEAKDVARRRRRRDHVRLEALAKLRT